MDDLTMNTSTYMGERDRKSQENSMLFHALNASLNDKALTKVNMYEEEYIIENQCSGVHLLRVIIRESNVDTPETIRNIRTQLSSLDQYMIHLQDDNIETFNQHVRTLVKNLNTRRQETHDLLVNLFKGYLSSKDYQFNRYIHRNKMTMMRET